MLGDILLCGSIYIGLPVVVIVVQKLRRANRLLKGIRSQVEHDRRG